MVATRGLITRGMHLHAQSSPASGAEPRRIEFAPTLNIWMFGDRGTAPTAIRVGHAQMALDSAPIGI